MANKEKDLPFTLADQESLEVSIFGVCLYSILCGDDAKTK